MSFTLPHDLSEVPDGQLTVAMLDNNFDAIQAWGRTMAERIASQAKENAALSARVDALSKLITANQGPTYAPKGRKAKAK
jgi:hypothetical protein